MACRVLVACSVAVRKRERCGETANVCPDAFRPLDGLVVLQRIQYREDQLLQSFFQRVGNDSYKYIHMPGVLPAPARSVPVFSHSYGQCLADL